MVETKGASPYAPKNERPGGRVRYLSGGLESIVTERREDAYKQMHAKCSGNYEIVREWDSVNDQVTSVDVTSTSRASANGSSSPYQWNANGYGSSNTSGYAVTSNITYRNIDFVCTTGAPQQPVRGRLGATPARATLPDNTIERTGASPSAPRVEDQVAGFLALEVGCSREFVSVTGSQRPAHRLVACGRAYVCIEGSPAPNCRLALSEQLDAGLTP